MTDPTAPPVQLVACINCGHAEPHNGKATDLIDVYDACTHLGCNCCYDAREAAPPVLSPLLTMTEAEFAEMRVINEGNRYVAWLANEVMTQRATVARLTQERDAQRTRLAKAEQENERLRERVVWLEKAAKFSGDKKLAAEQESERLKEELAEQNGTTHALNLAAKLRAAEQDVTRLRAALEMMALAIDNYFNYSPSRRDDKALGPIETARRAARAALAAPDTETSR